ncbi:protein Hri1p [[Candida] jaroonii]|uniref:Protein Hri1p n=1 Tax=[Candida] jaroonii TaxID=467808 RepID=A0ACA9Y2Q9_9ASCO|nr:protein Hri1p [[Candida] jaroonii]
MLSKRISIQWPPQEAGENTSTMVIYSKEGHFVDVRIFLENYPVIEENPTSKFDDIFEWAMVGDEISLESTIPDTYKLQFTHEIDSLAIMKAINENLPLDQCLTEADVGTFWKTDTEDRKETGNMTNPATGKKEDYVEIWRSVSSVQHTPENEVREPADEEVTPLYVLRIDTDEFHGQMIRSGNWIQGILHDKKNSKVPLNVIRCYVKDSKWEYLINYSNFKFPVDFDGAKGDSITIDNVKWTCIE